MLKDVTYGDIFRYHGIEEMVAFLREEGKEAQVYLREGECYLLELNPSTTEGIILQECGTDRFRFWVAVKGQSPETVEKALRSMERDGLLRVTFLS